MAQAKTMSRGGRGGEERVASASARVSGVGPEALLRLDPNLPRGFWAREGRWFAHLGASARVSFSTEADGGTRFKRVWDEARRLFSHCWKDPESDVHPPSPRLFGGFSFRDGHEAHGVWEHFPSAFFILPEVELVGGEGGGVLTCRALLSPGEDPTACRERLRSRLAAIKEALVGHAPPPSFPEPWIPATRSGMEPGSWGEAVEGALEVVADGGVSKVVLARVQSVSAEEGLDAVGVAMNLWKENPGAHVYSFEPYPGNVLLGAAPETVATVSEGRFRATAVAGSVARGGSEEEGAALARSLLQSRKDLHEHELCVQDMVNRLTPLSTELRSDAHPHVLTLASIQHLETIIESTLKPGETALSALEALHPTPAVCGLPRDGALRFLEEVEPFERGWYAGPVGWFDGEGNGVFVPALRSAVGKGTEWLLFAGAGIVAGSDPGQEWEETRIKFQPVLKALSMARAVGELQGSVEGDGGEQG